MGSASSVQQSGNTLAATRPAPVTLMVQEHANDARRFSPQGNVVRWEMDSPANYQFTQKFGNGQQAIDRAIARAQASGRTVVEVLDVGAGSGGFLLVCARSCAAAGLHCRALGLTGGREKPEEDNVSSIGVIEEDWLSPEEKDNTLIPVQDLLLLHNFPVEDMGRVHHRSYIPHEFDLVVSSWTWRHLADPLGSLEPYVKRLRSDGGELLVNECWFPFIVEKCSDSGGSWFDLKSTMDGMEAVKKAAEPFGLAIELHVEGQPRVFEMGEGGYSTALKCVSRRDVEAAQGSGELSPQQLDLPRIVAFTGEVSGPVSANVENCVNGLKGGASYGMARYRLK
mmetsp:Transcript_2112/g.4288  ORF Transcript_2112/g.4288 Transcript_2112/m.4288 type:complete len:339 (-) Transcript_2112:154-1170(-)